VDSTGDNLLAEFASVVDAVQCAVEVQQVLSAKNEALPENRRMHFRIGINSGDVIEEGDLIYGDGVNVAARVESLAEGGGISISGTAYDQLGKKLPLGYEYLGEQTVKNIEKPVRVYRVLPEAEAAGKVIGEKRPISRQWRWAAIGAVAVLIIGVGALAIWNFYLRPAFEPASVEKMAFPLPDEPSIAVLPFTNISGDPQQEYLSDGLTGEIITGLSMLPRLFVIARNSTFTYKGKAVKVQQVAEELGVRYVLEGSVQKSGERIRISAQLIDALTGRNLWAQRYDRDMKELFALQDEIIMKIMSAIQVKLTSGEIARITARGTNNLAAYIKVMQGLEYVSRRTKEANIQARKLAEEAIALDPEYPSAYYLLARTRSIDVYLGLSKSRRKSLQEAIKLNQKALAIDESHPTANTHLAYVYAQQRQHEKSFAQTERAVALNPNMARPKAMLGGSLFRAGRYEEAIQSLEKAIRLDPKGPSWYFLWLGEAYCFVGRYEEAIAEVKKAIGLAPESAWWHVALAAIYSKAGREEEARAEAAEVLRLDPKFSLEHYGKTMPWRKAELEPWLEALRKAGLPEKPPLPLPDKPSIAVLPFVNMSGDPKQEYFSDGMTEQIITSLSKVSDLFVIARTSSFKYKGKEVDLRGVGRELGVRYVLEGSVQKSGNRVRITAQLVDAKSGNHVWAERYDRELKNIFALQDEITLKIISALDVKLLLGGDEAAPYLRRGTQNLQALLKDLKASQHLERGTPDDYVLARKLSEEAIALDPEYPSPYLTLAFTHILDAFLGTSKSPRESMGKAFNLAQKVLAMDESDARGHVILGTVYMFRGEHEKAIAEHERAVFLDPNRAKSYMMLADSLTYAGRPQEAIPLLKKSMRLSPLSQTHASLCLYRLGKAHHTMGQYEESLLALKKARNITPNSIWIHLYLTATYIHLGREEEARAAADEVRRISRRFSLERFAKRLKYKDQAVKESLIDAWRKAGLK
jgi:adenylate cyclase